MPLVTDRRTVLGYILGACMFAGAASTLHADDNFIIMQSTTSTQNSGLFEHILPQFTQKTGIEVRVVAA